MSVDAELEAILAETAPDRASLAQPFTAGDAARDDRAAAAHEQPLHWNGARLRPYSAWSASATEQIIFFIKKKLAAFADETQMDSALEEYYARAIHLFAHIADENEVDAAAWNAETAQSALRQFLQSHPHHLLMSADTAKLIVAHRAGARAAAQFVAQQPQRAGAEQPMPPNS